MLSSSGFRDGLGERDLQFDRETGEVRERLLLRPELAAYESALRRRIGRLASMADPLLVPIHRLEHDRATGRLAVISRHVSGTRLGDTLRAAREHELVPDLTIGLFLAAEILNAAHTFHSLSGLPHGALTPGRVIVTSEAEVVLADFAYAEVIEAARFTPRRLWDEFGVAHWLGDPFSFDGDVRQTGLIAIALMLGRPLDSLDVPHGVDALLAEVEEAAMIRGGRLFAEPVIGWLRRALGREGEPGFAASDEAAETCGALLTDRERSAARPALLLFLQELETISDRDEFQNLQNAPTPSTIAATEPSNETVDVPEEEPETPAFRPAPLRLVERAPETETEPEPTAYVPYETAFLAEQADSASTPDLGRQSVALDTDPVVAPEPFADCTPAPEPAAPSFEPEPVAASSEPEPAAAGTPAPEPAASSFEPEPASASLESEPAAPYSEPEPETPAIEPAASLDPEPFRPSYLAPESATFAEEPEPVLEPEPVPEPASQRAEAPALETEPEPVAQSAAALQGAEVEEVNVASEAVAQEGGSRVNSPSPFALLDRLKKRARRTPPESEPPSLPAPAPVIPVPAPMVAQAPVAPPSLAPRPIPAPPPVSVPVVLHTVTQPAESPLAPAPIRLKDPFAQKKTAALAPRRDLSDRPVAIFEHPEADDRGSGFRIPWKMAAAAIVVLVTGLAALNMEWSGPSRAAAIPPGTLVVETTPPGSEVFIDGERKGVTPAVLQVPPGRHEMKLTRKGAEHAWSIDVASGARRVERLDWTALRQTGGIEVISTTPGSKVLVDGKPRGETPLVLADLTPGRHLVVVQGPNGNVRRRVTVVAGETTKLDLAIYSGWVIVSAPIELKILENGKAIATAGEGPVMLSAGPHTIELVNELLSYRSSHTVDIGPGEEERLNITPKGRLNVNAIPWAEVFVDGDRIGETPLANVSVTLGARELLFKHPEHGERRMAVTVTGSEPAQVSIDLTKPPSP